MQMTFVSFFYHAVLTIFFLNNSVLTFWVACSPFWTILCCSTMLLIRSSHISIFCSGCCGNFLQRPAAVHLRSNSYRPTSYSCAHCKLWCFQGKGQNCLFPALLVILYNGCIFLKLLWTYLYSSILHFFEDVFLVIPRSSVFIKAQLLFLYISSSGWCLIVKKRYICYSDWACSY